jgi:hypothetical protein
MKQWVWGNNVYIYNKGNKIGVEGARMISEALKTNTTITVMDLSSSNDLINNNVQKRSEVKQVYWNEKSKMTPKGFKPAQNAKRQ